jgi:hypothetical protein
MRFLTPVEIGRLTDAIRPPYRALVLVGAYGGLRIGELAGLRRERVDLLRGTVEIAEIMTEVAGKLQVGPPKMSCPWVVATHQRLLCHSLAFPRTPSGVRPLVQRPVWERSVL